MSKSIRIKDYLYDEISRRAEHEHRPLVSQLELLLQQALKLQPTITDQPEVEMDRMLKGVGPAIEVVAERPEPPPAAPKRRLHPCKHHVPPSRECQYCDVQAGA